MKSTNVQSSSQRTAKDQINGGKEETSLSCGFLSLAETAKGNNEVDQCPIPSQSTAKDEKEETELLWELLAFEENRRKMNEIRKRDKRKEFLVNFSPRKKTSKFLILPKKKSVSLKDIL